MILLSEFVIVVRTAEKALSGGGAKRSVGVLEQKAILDRIALLFNLEANMAQDRLLANSRIGCP